MPGRESRHRRRLTNRVCYHPREYEPGRSSWVEMPGEQGVRVVDYRGLLPPGRLNLVTDQNCAGIAVPAVVGLPELFFFSVCPSTLMS